MKVYEHFGDTTFRPEKIGPTHNRIGRNKPANALWASGVDDEYPWKTWCENEEFCLENLKKSFKFRLKESARVFVVDSRESFERLPQNKKSPLYALSAFNPDFSVRDFDFDMLKKMGYDAVEVSISKCGALYDLLYGWDCDSIAILNPDVVVVL